MRLQFRNFVLQIFSLFLIIGLLAFGINAQQANNETIRGRVVDAANAIVVGAEVTAVGADNAERKTQTNQTGEFSLSLAPGKYIFRVSSPGFALYENAALDVLVRRSQTLTFGTVSSSAETSPRRSVSGSARLSLFAPAFRLTSRPERTRTATRFLTTARRSQPI